MKNKNLHKLNSFILYISILIVSISFNFAHNSPSGWYQQFMPNLNGASLSDITFLDSLTGFSVTRSPGYILKTTNGGDNWNINYTHNDVLVKIQFINKDTGYSLSFQKFLKTYNQGDSWEVINLPTSFAAEDMFVLNKDTMWAADGIPTFGGLFRTTNGGTSWVRQFSVGGSGNPEKVYFFNRNIGFISDNLTYIRKTTNSGNTWTLLNAPYGFKDIYFSDSLTGWKANEGIQKTTDGGLFWTELNLPPKGTPVLGNGTIIFSRIKQFSNINKDTIWGVGSSVFFGSGRFRGLIYKTTNGGETWGYQLPDTSIDISIYPYVVFTDSRNGWAYNVVTGIHTKTGGNDTTYFVGIKQVPNYIPEKFTLAQNYPNPFNPSTSISFELKEASHVTLRVYDIRGVMIKELVNGAWSASKYIVEFDGTDLSSGVYFYRIEIKGVGTNEKFLETKRMMLIK